MLGGNPFFGNVLMGEPERYYSCKCPLVCGVCVLVCVCVRKRDLPLITHSDFRSVFSEYHWYC